MLAGFAWLTDGAQAGDSLFVHYSGHGGSVRDANSDERDNRDETLIPVDFRSAGQITDDLILASLVLEVPKGAMLTVVIDACHSGTVLDLPYTFIADSETIEQVHNGAAPAQMVQNSGFSFTHLLRVGMMMYDLHQNGASKAEIVQAAMGSLSRAFFT